MACSCSSSSTASERARLPDRGRGRGLGTAVHVRDAVRLSLDYQVFLLSRIREHFDQGADTAAAVRWGVASTARIITGAALIIVAVFSGFARGDLVMFQQMGFGIAVSLLIDATVIRSVVLPSVMVLLGDRNWYLPRWLTWIPHLEVEAHADTEPEPRPA